MNDKYLTYNSIELAEDDHFARWVRKGSHQQDWDRWLARHPEKKEAVAEARQLVETLQFKEPALRTDTEALWARIRTSVQEGETTSAPVPPRRRTLIFYLGAVAAAASVALLLFWGLNFLNTRSIDAGRGVHLAHTLPDASRVTLNADSRIQYQEKDWSGDRQLSLRGEAYFEVEKGTPFVVQTPRGKVTVLGTTFNVYSRAEELVVRCTSGRVRVTTSSDPDGVILGPGEECRQTPGGILAKQDFDTNLGVGWLRDIYRFDKQPLGVVFEELERQFDVRIKASEAIRSRTYSGAFSGQALEAALRDVCWPLNLVAEPSGKTIFIRTESSE